MASLEDPYMIRQGTWDLYHDGFLVHTKLRNLHPLLKERLEELTLDPKHDSFMHGLLVDAYEDKDRVDRVDVFILFDPRIPEYLTADKSLSPVAWAVVHEAYWIPPEGDKHRRCNEISVYTDPRWRGQGYATRLVKFAKERLAHTKRRWVAVPDTEAGRALYSKLRITDMSDWIGVNCLDEISNYEDDGREPVILEEPGDYSYTY